MFVVHRVCLSLYNFTVANSRMHNHLEIRNGKEGLFEVRCLGKRECSQKKRK